MINIITLENDMEFYRKFSTNRLILASKDNVEDTFKRIVEWHSNAFKDEMSLKIMQEIDNAVRVGAYGVKTPIGKSCITCLSSGCKLGLLLNYYKNEDIPIFTSLSRAGDNVWQFIAENFDISFYTTDYDFYRLCDSNIDITIDGVLYKKEEKNFSALFDLYLSKEDEPYKMTKERELEAYNSFASRQKDIIKRDLKEELSLKDFVLSFEPDYDFETYDLDYKLINHCALLPIDFTFRKHPIWFVSRKDSKYEFFTNITVKYPDFFEFFIGDIVYAFDYEDREYIYYSNQYDEFFALALNGEERCEVKTYTENVLFGVLVNAKDKVVTLYDKHQAIQLFHDFYTKVEE